MENRETVKRRRIVIDEEIDEDPDKDIGHENDADDGLCCLIIDSILSCGSSYDDGLPFRIV